MRCTESVGTTTISLKLTEPICAESQRADTHGAESGPARSSVYPREGEMWGLEPVRSDASYR